MEEKQLIRPVCRRLHLTRVTALSMYMISIFHFTGLYVDNVLLRFLRKISSPYQPKITYAVHCAMDAIEVRRFLYTIAFLDGIG